MEWRKIEGFPQYEVNELGQVRSWRKKQCSWRNPDKKLGWRETPVLLTGSFTPLGYIAFVLRDERGAIKRRMGHRLVAQAFLGVPADKSLTDVAHNDGNPSNNRVENLRWATHRDNQMDMRKHGTMQDGEKCITCKITKEVAEQIRTCGKNGPRGIQRKLAKQHGLSVAQVCRIVNSTRWASI